MAKKTCKGTTRDGARCKVDWNLRGGFCLWHDPERRAEAKSVQSHGGKVAQIRRRMDARSVPPAPQTLDDVVAWTSYVARAVATKRMDPRVAQEITRALAQLRAAIEKRDLARELDTLREQVRIMKRGRA